MATKLLTLATQQGWYLEMIKRAFISLGSKKQEQDGWILISAIIIILFLTAMGLAIAQLTAIQYQDTKMEEYSQNAQLTAEAGIEQSVTQLNSNSTFSGYSTPQQFFNNSVQGIGDFTTTITTNSNGKAKTIVSTGEVYQTSNDTTPTVTNSIKVTVVGTSGSGYSVMTGPGGLIMGGQANIVNSNLYVNGTITMNGSSKIGTYANPVDVNVANDACPTGSNPGSSYPEVCTSSQPINLASNTSIYGSVCATGQTSTGPNNNIQGGNGGQGLELGCIAPVTSQPSYNRLAQIQAVTTTESGASSNICNQSQPLPTNLELTGDVSIGGNCNFTINGNIYITGNLTIGGSSQITVDNSLGTTPPVIMVDGTITIDGQPSMITDSSGTGIEFITFDSTNSCTTGTTTTDYCSSLSGNDLYNSQSLQTINLGSSVNLPGMIFDAYWSEITLAGGGNIGAATGQTVNLDGSGSVIFGTELASNTTTWSITSYEPNH